jgi:hypothetical protein
MLSAHADDRLTRDASGMPRGAFSQRLWSSEEWRLSCGYRLFIRAAGVVGGHAEHPPRVPLMMRAPGPSGVGRAAAPDGPGVRPVPGGSPRTGPW